MKKLILLFTSFCLLSCSKENNGSENTFIDIGLNILLLNSEGINLIDSEAYPEGNYKVYYEINGVKTFYQSSADISRGFLIYPEADGSKQFRINCKSLDKKPYSTIYIEWSATQTDKLFVTYEIGENSTRLDKILLNDAPLTATNYENNSGVRTLKIIK